MYFVQKLLEAIQRPGIVDKVVLQTGWYEAGLSSPVMTGPREVTTGDSATRERRQHSYRCPSSTSESKFCEQGPRQRRLQDEERVQGTLLRG